MLFEKLVTSHVGSFPLTHSWDNVRKIFKDLIDLGIDIPPYPQMRSFIDIYLEPLAKAGIISLKGSRYFADEKILRDTKPPTAEIPEAKIVSEISEKMGFKGILRAPITGPFTLSSRIYFSESASFSATAMAKKDLVLNFFTEYVRSFVKQMVDLGYKFIVIDEPMLANIIGRRIILYGYRAEDIVEVYSRVLEPAKHKGAIRGTHVCGRLPKKLPEILAEVDVLDVLNHEFKDSPENLEVFTKDLLEKHDKILSPGVVSSKKLRVESFEETYSLLSRILNKFGERVNIVSADCGFGALRTGEVTEEKAYEIAKKKLKLIVKVVKKANEEFKG